MKTSKIIWALIIAVSLNLVCFGQKATSRQQQERLDQLRESEKIRKQQREYENQTAKDLARTHRISEDKIEPVRTSRTGKRYPNEKELAIVAPKARYFQQFSDFLEEKDIGITRLVSDIGCGIDFRLVQAVDDCLKYENIPGYGSAYSFRTNLYVLGRFADLVYKDKVLYAFGNLTTGFFTELGDVPLAEVTNKTKGANYTFSFKPKRKLKKIEEQNDRFVGGITSNGFEYKKSARLVEGKTYLLRSVAYKLKTKTKSFRSGRGRYIVKDNSSYDRRRDIIVAIRVIEIDKDGAVTFLWKVLEDNDAPKIILPKT